MQESWPGDTTPVTTSTALQAKPHPPKLLTCLIVSNCLTYSSTGNRHWQHQPLPPTLDSPKSMSLRR